MRSSHRASVILVALLGAGCTAEKMTEIVISIATDLKIPGELKAVGLEVKRNSATKIQHKWDLSLEPMDGFITLPATLGLLPGGDLTTQLEIEVLGFNKNRTQADVSRTAKLHFIEGRILWLRMNLLKRCLYINKKCDPGFTCNDEGECESNVVDPETLPGWTIDADIGIAALDGGVDAAPKPDAPLDAPPKPDAPPQPDLPLKPDIWPDGPNCLDSGWCKIRNGTFTMGSPDAELCRQDDEVQHKVTLTRAFEMMDKEVTEKDMVAFAAKRALSYKPAWTACGGDCPADNISWHLAAAYCNDLTKNAKDRCFDCTYAAGSVTCTVKTDYLIKFSYYQCPGYRLPTDAEWEYACRAGTTKAFYSGSKNSLCLAGVDPNASSIGWYGGNNPTPIKARKMKGGQLKANAWGLLDMPGNIWEWCFDGYQADLTAAAQTDPVFKPSDATRVRRGGDYGNFSKWMRAANRAGNLATFFNYALGFRCARTLTGTISP